MKKTHNTPKRQQKYFACLLVILPLIFSAGNFASSDVTPSFAAFGEISFSDDVTDESVPIGHVSEYSPGTVKICAVFPFMFMEDGMQVEVLWLYNDEWFYSTEEEWDEGGEGITHRTVSWENDRELEPGIYTLQLFIHGQLARSADIEVLAPEEAITLKPTKSPEELIDPDLMKAWEILAYSDNDLLTKLAGLVTDYGIELRLTDEIDSNGQYVYTHGKKEPGKVYISWDFWKKNTWEEVSATLAHELTHAVQHLTSDEGTFGCTVERDVRSIHGKILCLYGNWQGGYPHEVLVSNIQPKNRKDLEKRVMEGT